ncbi:MAG TPA: fasciclin domain-containing protein [Dongiaceae bacterium]|nr:fasciclin domain-containing protein [Dongiaceae bacterium]
MLRRTLLAGLATLPLVAACQSGGSGSSGSKAPSALDEDIPGRLTALRQFTQLLKSAQIAGLMGTLQSKGPYTLFAPTDRAFENLDDRDLQALQKDKARLKRVLEYHLVRGRFGRGDFVAQKTVQTVAGPRLTIRKMGQVIKINEANIETENIGASNGVIHAIDMVLMPPRGS